MCAGECRRRPAGEEGRGDCCGVGVWGGVEVRYSVSRLGAPKNTGVHGPDLAHLSQKST